MLVICHFDARASLLCGILPLGALRLRAIGVDAMFGTPEAVSAVPLATCCWRRRSA
jgi:hypothetical protein